MLEITCARDWASFVEAYSRVAAGMLLPDWSKVSQHHDGVHVTARAVVATQGFSFRTRRGVTAPAFWDVEQTLWLNWIFASTVLLDIAR
jgi:hypothetical protein